ncbi:hypothetical protein BGX26_011546 [Mortierella sp. AD094]|nr:hypothetical protein BGX26_011546 [Mortierella sp. AD094]
MVPSDISSSSPTLTLTDPEPAHPAHQYNTHKSDMFSNQFKEDSLHQLRPLHEEEVEELQDSSIEPTEVTIETNVDPLSESTTTTTTVHLPFQVARQCDPPKVISWMKVEDPKRTKSSKHNRRHHPHQRPDKSSKLLHNIFPFLKKEETIPREPKKSSKKKKDPKKNDTSFITLFSIQVSVLGKVHVPSSATPDQSEDMSTPADLEPKRTVSAQLDLSETTSYVIHRTFDDFEHLSEMVLRLENILHTSNHHQQSSSASSTPQSEEAPTLTALKVHHPHPGLYQTLLKQFSNVKANQRAFDASATTHGFNEGGAFERILELNQYLENVWYWLLPEHTPQQLDLSAEQQVVMQWFMPSPESAHTDGRQMKDRKDQDSKWQDLQRLYGPRSRQHQQQEGEEHTTDSTVAQTSVTSHHDQAGSKKPGSASSLPSLSSSASSSSSMCISSDEDRNGHDYDNNHNIHDRRMTNSRRTSSTIINSSPMADPSLERFHNDVTSGHDEFEEIPVNSVESGRQGGEGSVGGGGVEGSHASDSNNNSIDNNNNNKINRRMSFSHVLRSFSPSKSLHPRQRQSMHEMAKKRSSTMASGPTQEIFIWNSVTIKHPPAHFQSAVGTANPAI